METNIVKVISQLLILTIEDIVYNPGAAHVLSDQKSEVNSSPRRLQIKKRKRSDGKYVFVLINLFIPCLLFL